MLSMLAPGSCWSCGARAPSELCAVCRRAVRRLDGTVGLGEVVAWAPTAYEGPAAALVRAFKYRGATGLAGSLAARMTACAPRGFLDGVLVPVPMPAHRRRRRGYDQARLLADALSRRSGRPVAAVLVLRDRGARQVGRDRRQRLDALAGSVLARGVVPARAVLVDDVITTGATLAACARALREAGAAEVRAVAFARTPGR